MIDLVARLRLMENNPAIPPGFRLDAKKAADEIELLRLAVVRYGDPMRMGTVEPMALQQAIDAAYETTPRETKKDRYDGLLTSGERQEMQEEQSGARYLASRGGKDD